MGTRGGDSISPIGAVQVRCPMPEAWLLPIGHRSFFSPIKGLRGPLSRGTAPLPGKLWSLWETVQLTSAQNTALFSERSQRNHFRILESMYSVTRGNGNYGNAFFIFTLTTRGITLGGFQCGI